MTKLLRRPVLALLLISVVGIAACTVPTETEVEMGQRLSYNLDASKLDAAAEATREIGSYLQTRPGVEDVSVAFMEEDGGPVVLDLMVWGRGVDTVDLNADLSGRWPVLAGAELTTEALSGTVRTSLAEKVGHQVFNIEVLDGTPEEMRAQILEQIYASGFDGEADVQVDRDGDVVTIGVEMTQDTEDGQTEDELIIELKDE